MSEELFCKTLKVQRAVDNTSLSLLKRCPRKYEYTILRGWKPKQTSIHLSFGKLIHDSLESYDRSIAEGLSHDDAQRRMVRQALLQTSYPVVRFWAEDGSPVKELTIPEGTTAAQVRTLAPDLSTLAFTFHRKPLDLGDNIKSRQTLIQTLIWYTEQFHTSLLRTWTLPDGKPGLELSFRVEFPLSTPDGDPYIYCGHVDRLVTDGTSVDIHERKTTKNQITGSYFAGFDLSSQISGYLWGLSIGLGTPVRSAVIDAMQVGVTFARFVRQPSARFESQLSEFMLDTTYWLQVAELFAQRGHYPMNTESCFNCEFKEVCRRDPTIRERFLPAEFKQDQWNPLDVR